MKQYLDETLSLAPMVSYTTRYARLFYNLLAPDILLYTEMITTSALIRNRNLQQLKRFDNSDAVCQLAGNNQDDMVTSIKIAQDTGYKEINLNLGCPSKQVQNNKIGVCMMKEPAAVADLFEYIDSKTDLPVSIKCRIGVDDLDSYAYLHGFISLLVKAGCRKFILHARKAWLKGLNPKQNRTKPPINYQYVYKLKQDFPELQIIINGDIVTSEQTKQHLEKVDGVMIGRGLVDDPMLANELQNRFFSAHHIDIAEIIAEYLSSSAYFADDHHLSSVFLLKNLFGLASGRPGAKKWRQFLTQQMQQVRQGKVNSKLVLDMLVELGIFS